MNDLYSQMMQTAIGAGLAVIPKEKAAKLLAACYVYGDEPFVLSPRLHTDTMLAAQILFGEAFDVCVATPKESNAKINRYYREIVTSDKVPEWLAALGAEYDVDFPQYLRK